MSFQHDIKKLRVDHNMTQKELANLIHVSRQTISAWENGKNYPSLEVLRALSAVFDISFEKILFGEELMHTKETIAETINQDLSLKRRYKKATMILSSIILLLILWISILILGYQKGIDTIDRFDPFLQYSVAYTKAPNNKITNPNNAQDGKWTKWFSDNEMGTQWSKLTLSTGLNPGLDDPYVMAYHKGSYVKIARFVPGNSVNSIIKSNISAIDRLVHSKSHDNLSLNMSSEDKLKNKIHSNHAIQELVIQ
ncbi:helix-turn-helix transcriptional regulator [Weissella coleopterorum]|uniref:Helix-turn-helix transcriptional regulator n=1 Tax=Weissella coleopterorum TaxID=2714949 RepID=A0A6G8B1P3_9LACO|nr:helix-turn-helix transcriptional regulator [Weissella coleopterorum]QIL51053.1 helix-turn-helix transcriptional regulator [Weissella coleopterorum]